MNYSTCKNCGATLTSADDENEACTQCEAKLPIARQMLIKVANAYDNDPGISDLDNEQPVWNPNLNLGDVRAARSLLQ